MGRVWGKIAYSRGQTRYTLSSYEQNPFYGFFSKGVPNMARRVYAQIFYMAPPFIAGYMIMRWGDAENARVSRKNPKDYENDE